MPTISHSPSQIIWGAMSINGTAPLYFLPAGVTMNGSPHVNLLREKLQLLMAVHQCSVFMHDGAPCHRPRWCSRDVAAAPQTPQLGAAQANFGGPS